MGRRSKRSVQVRNQHRNNSGKFGDSSNSSDNEKDVMFQFDGNDLIDMGVFDQLMANNEASESQHPKRPGVYIGDSARTKRRKDSEHKAAAKLTGQNLFQAFKTCNPYV